MSLINQMLQDLDKRRASGAERGALPDQVRVLPREEMHSMPWWLIGISAVAALVAVFAWQFNHQPAAPAPVAQTPAPPDALPTQSSPLPGTPDRPASRLALQLEKVPPSVPRVPERATGTASEAQTAGKPAPAPVVVAAVVASGSAVPAKAPPAAVKAEPAKPAAPTAEPPKPASPAAAASVTVAIAPIKPAISTPKTAEVVPETKAQAALVNSQIDKRAQTLTPQQQAENDYREAANFLNQGRLAEAQEGFRRALQNYPAHIGARQGLFGLLVDAKKNGEAEQLLQEGLALNPNQSGFAMALGSLQYERGDIAGAIETMQKSAPAAQSSPDYLARFAGLLQRQSRHREAIDNYQAALRLAPGSGVWLMGLGISLQALNRNGEAQEVFRRAKSSNTLNPELQAFVDQRLKQLQ
jgi:MSHA biogenesis protein MshN